MLHNISCSRSFTAKALKESARGKRRAERKRHYLVESNVCPCVEVWKADDYSQEPRHAWLQHSLKHDMLWSPRLSIKRQRNRTLRPGSRGNENSWANSVPTFRWNWLHVTVRWRHDAAFLAGPRCHSCLSSDMIRSISDALAAALFIKLLTGLFK